MTKTSRQGWGAGPLSKMMSLHIRLVCVLLPAVSQGSTILVLIVWGLRSEALRETGCFLHRVPSRAPVWDGEASSFWNLHLCAGSSWI
jgi:hypothetical protein